ncbi:DUF4102 domain-containing protein [Paracoccus onubensis]|uniref:DUF4102 domain-containing protein n=2 Tax=Paracoccus onubensis TaxID=1675788 RepID=A0A418T4T8_9RHOB|nr:DUF4102 domain-containing protein [Paracoccus onubensis]
MKYRVGGGRAGRIRWGAIGQHGALTPDQARDIAQRWAAVIAAGGDPAGEKIEKRKSPAVSELMGQYLESHVAAASTPEIGQVLLAIVIDGTEGLQAETRKDVYRKDVA